MPLNTDSGEYERDSREAKLERLQAYARDRFDFEPEEHDDAALTAFLDVFAAVNAQNQEQSLADVFDASFIDTAEGANLERVARRIGVERRPAVAASGVQRFIGEGHTTSHTIPAGTTVRTANDTAAFETDEDASIGVLDDMEDGDIVSNYSGDTADYTASTDVVYRGSQALRAMGGSSGKILLDGVTVTRGDTISVRGYPESGGAGPDEIQLLYLASSTSSADVVFADTSNDTFGFRNGATTNVTVPQDEFLLVEVTPRLDGTREATLYAEDGTEITTVTEDESGNNPTWEGQVGVGHSNGEVIYDDLSKNAVAVETTAVSAGSHANVAEGTLTVLDTTLSGVDETTNSIPTGDSSYRGSNGVVLRAGRDEEDDEALRERVKRDDEGSMGKATIEAVLDAVSDLESVSSLSVEPNKSDSEDDDGRPPNSFEVIVPSHANFPEVARAIFANKAGTSNDSGGHIGTEVTEYVESEVVDNYSETISFTEAPVTDVDMSLSIVVNDDYSGDDALRRRVVEYVGGTRPDGTNSVGLGLGEDVYVDELKERIMEDDGVVGFDDANTSFTPSTTTDANGLTIIDVADTEIAEVDGTDGSVSIDTTSV